MVLLILSGPTRSIPSICSPLRLELTLGRWEKGQTTGRFGKRDGSYTGLSQMLSAEFNPVQNFRFEVSATSIYHDISGVTGLDDRRRGGWQALSERRGLTIEQPVSQIERAEPRWGRIDETTGEPC